MAGVMRCHPAAQNHLPMAMPANLRMLFDKTAHQIAPCFQTMVANRAATNEVLVTNTVMELVSGSGVVFSNRGSYSSERLSENCQLFATV